MKPWIANDQSWKLEKMQQFEHFMNRTKVEKVKCKMIHQIWLGTNRIPSQCVQYMKTWQEWHPTWKYKLWTDKDVKSELKNQAAFDRAPNYGAKSDILRYEILFKYGGLYVDVDFECIKPLDSLLVELDFAIGLSNTGMVEVNNGLIYALPRHAILNALVVDMEQIKFLVLETRMVEFLTVEEQNRVKQIAFAETIAKTGPGKCTQMVAKYGTDGDIVFPIRFFYPKSNQKEEYASTSDNHAVHHWAKSWQ